MNYLSRWEFGRADPAGPPEPERAYSVGPGEEVADIMARHFTDAMDEVSGYGYGAPLAVTTDTVIREYEVPGTNAITTKNQHHSSEQGSKDRGMKPLLFKD